MQAGRDLILFVCSLSAILSSLELASATYHQCHRAVGSWVYDHDGSLKWVKNYIRSLGTKGSIGKYKELP